MTKPSTEAQKRAQEIIDRNVPRHELAPFLAAELQSLMDEQHGWVCRVENAEFECKRAQQHADACERSACEWKAKADEVERQLAEEREWFAAAQRGLKEAEARLAELVRRTREELEYWRDMRTIGTTAHERFDKLLKEFGDGYEGGDDDQ
jgi:chromosome segregation ATPase